MKSTILFLCLSLVQVWGCTEIQTVQIEKDWWETAQFYQIYPRSFKDSNNDGIGDLNGITEKLDHLKNIGVDAVWLSPIYKSPMADFGYDISDLYSISPEYGTMEDFDKLIQKANELKIKVILDFVPNHTSDENEWFIKSVNREKGYEDFYVWHDGKPNPDGVSRNLPPSNWLQAFRGSAWEWNDKRKQYYLHQFAVKQPDLNYRNPEVVETMKGVLRYWLHKGVAGFRVDAVPWCFEIQPDKDGNYPDEPESGFTDDKDDPSSLKHIYTLDQPETVDMVYQWHKMLEDFKRIHGGDTRVLLIESYSPIDYTIQFYGNKTVDGAQVPFNFHFILDGNSDSNAEQLVNIINSWLNKMPSGKVPNWVMGNHDQRRVGSRYGADKIDTMNMIQMMLPGVSITYNGEEIGMLDGDITWEQSKDPAACNSNPDIFQKFTRDPARTPFQWDDSTSAGFSTNANTWLPVNDNYKVINLEAEKSAPKSHYKVYQSLAALRRTDVLKNGQLKVKSINNNNVLVIERYLGNDRKILVANIKSEPETVTLKEVDTNIPEKMVVSVGSVSSSFNAGDSVSTTSLPLQGYDAVVLST